jgi:hypothetical protein
MKQFFVATAAGRFPKNEKILMTAGFFPIQ